MTGFARTARVAAGVVALCPDARDLLWVDALAQQGLSALCLSRIAELLDDVGGAREWRRRHGAARDLLNRLYWDERDGFYYDIRETSREKVRVPTLASYWPLLAEVATPAQARRMLARLTDDRTFGGPMPAPSLSRADPDFHADGAYWRGATWLPTAYMAVKAADAYGDFATNKAGRFVRPDFCGWSALGPISLFVEDVIGIKRADAFANVLTCDFERSPKGRVGVENYAFGKVRCDVVATAEEISVESNAPFTLKADGRAFGVKAGRNVFRRR